MRRISVFVLGLVSLSFGYALILKAGLGNDTIGVFAHGLSIQTGLTIGNGSQMINLVALFIVLLFDRKRVGIGTIVSAISIGLILDLCMTVLPVPELVSLQGMYLGIGIILAGVGIAYTIHSDFGASPIDSLMMVLAQQLKITVRMVRISMDVLLVVTGWLLGGLLGVGTVFTVVGIGPVIQKSLQLMRNSK
jgi:uncharacterized membrane protein YczE